RHELQGPAEDGQPHQHGVPEAEPRNIHIDPVSHPQEPEPGENGDGVGERRGKRSAADALCPHPSRPPRLAPNSIPPAARRGNYFSTSSPRGRGAAPRCANPWQKKEP